jgi:metal-responsive CopG/Arc/MetJ family transcriptional regulator
MKEAVFTVTLEPSLHTEFMAAAAEEDRPASQILRELMQGYIEQRRQSLEYDDYLRRKVEVAQSDKAAGRGYPNDEIEAEFSAARSVLLRTGA